MAQTQAGTAGQFDREIVLAAAYELDNFVAVACGNLRSGPLGAWKNLQVAFDGDAARAQAESLQQLRHRDTVRGRFRFAIDHNRDCSGRFHRLGPWFGAQVKAQAPFGAVVDNFDH